MFTSSEVTNLAQARTINNWEAFKCSDNRFLHSFLLSAVPRLSAMGKSSSNKLFIDFLADLQTKALECSENMLAGFQVGRAQANQKE